MQPWIDQAAARRPDHPALVAAGETLSWARLGSAAASASGTLVARGVGRGDRVALSLPAGPDFVVALHAVLRLGAVAVPVDLRLAPGEQGAIEGAADLVVDAALPAGGPAPPGPQEPGAAAMVIHTSGTTGTPRPVVLTLGNWATHARVSAAALGHPQDERYLCAMPLSHVGGLGVLVRAAVGATTVVLQPRFEVGAVATALGDDAITAVSLVPTTLGRLLDAGLEPSPVLRLALVGGGPVPPAQLERALAAGLPVAQTYGLTEACSQVSAERPGEGSSTAGRPLPGTEVSIASGGEVLVRGGTVAPAATGADGWLHTGDLGTLDAAGRLSIVGRAADTIVTGGENVAPAEVEGVLEEHPAVAEVAVLGRADPEWGERVVAVVVLRPGASATPDELRAHAAGRLAGFKVPKAVELRDALPRTASGKVRRTDLR